MLVANKSDLPGFRRPAGAARAVRGARATRSSRWRRHTTRRRCCRGSPGRTPRSSASRAWASRRSSTRSPPTPTRQDGGDFGRRSPRGATRRPTRRCIYLPAAAGDGWIVDTPGLKAFGLAHIAPDDVAHAFVELRPFLGHCRFRDCRHRNEPGLRGARGRRRRPHGAASPRAAARARRGQRRGARAGTLNVPASEPFSKSRRAARGPQWPTEVRSEPRDST